jgi:hypothetical protein
MKNKIKETVMLVITLIIVLIVLSAMNTYREPIIQEDVTPNYEEYNYEEYVPSNEDFTETPNEELYNTNTNIN